MFDPADFRSIARSCTHSGGEASCRTSIGRSYYSVYMQLDSYVDKWPAVLIRDQGRGRHERTINALRHVTHTRTGHLRHDLKSLKRFRTLADYDRGYTKAQNDCARALRLADKIAPQLTALDDNPTP